VRLRINPCLTPLQLTMALRLPSVPRGQLLCAQRNTRHPPITSSVGQTERPLRPDFAYDAPAWSKSQRMTDAISGVRLLPGLTSK